MKTDTLPFSRFERMLAFRYLRARRKEGFISVIAIFSFLGIVLGVATLIAVMGVMNGVHNGFLDRVLGLNAHVNVMKNGGAFTDYQPLAEELRKVESVNAVIPMVQGQGMASNGRHIIPAQIWGISKDELTQIKKVASNIEVGSLDSFGSKPSVAIGAVMANELNVTVGDSITLVTPKGARTPFGVAPRVKRYKISAVFKVDMQIYDRTFIYMPLEAAQKYFSKPGRVDVIHVKVNDPENVDASVVALDQVVKDKLGREDIYMIDWRYFSKDFFRVLQAEQNMMFLILLIILIVATFNIISGIIMLVKDKGRDIAVLRTMGATRGAIMRVFLITGASIGIVGTFTGFGLGVAICWNIDKIQAFISYFTGKCVVDPKFYQFCELPAEMDPWQNLNIIILSLVLSILATLYPSWRAAQMDPVEALRYE